MINPGRIERSWFWGRIDASGDCWEWQGSISTGGYGQISYLGKHWPTHRLVWTMLVADIGKGMQLDHLCMNALCCNPDHLEEVTKAENMARMRKSKGRGHERKCHRGHTLRWVEDSRGKTVCQACVTERVREHRERKKQSGEAK